MIDAMDCVMETITIPSFSTVENQTFERVPACYTLYGDLHNNKPLALIFHGFSSDSNLHTWWNKFNFLEMTKKYNIICINSLGSSHGSFGPESIDPKTGCQYHANFPCITIQDTVNFVMAALTYLGIKSAEVVLGCSLGGMQVLDMYLRFPQFSKKFISVAAAPVPYMTKLINIAQARMVDYAVENNKLGMIEDMLGLSRFFFRLSCTSETALNILREKLESKVKGKGLDVLQRYFEKDDRKFQTQFSPYSNSIYLKMIARFNYAMPSLLSTIKTKLLLVSITDDFFVPHEFVEDVYKKISSVNNYCEIKTFSTSYGHEAWILDGGRFYEFIKNDLNM